MLLDVFPFTNEFRILKARLDYLNSIVDLFVIVEADITYSGIAKRMLFQDLRGQFGQINHKIMVVPQHYKGSFDFKKLPKDENDIEAPSYLMEKFQRDGALEALRGMPGDAKVMVGDVDEIPNQQQIAKVLNNMQAAEAVVMSTGDAKGHPPVVLEMDNYMYTLGWKTKNKWLGTVITNNNVVNAVGLSKLRNDRSKLLKVENGGWHLNNFMPAEGVQAKIMSFAHQHLNEEKTRDLEYIKKCMGDGKDVFGRKEFKLEAVSEPTIPATLLKSLTETK